MQSPLLLLGGVDFCPHSRLFHSQKSDFSFKWLCCSPFCVHEASAGQQTVQSSLSQQSWRIIIKK